MIQRVLVTQIKNRLDLQIANLFSRHYSSLMHVSLEARIVIMRCLVVDPKKRTSFEARLTINAT